MTPEKELIISLTYAMLRHMEANSDGLRINNDKLQQVYDLLIEANNIYMDIVNAEIFKTDMQCDD